MLVVVEEVHTEMDILKQTLAALAAVAVETPH
jgi:hypothetical protein